jgi:hypothetical protein
MPMQTVSTYLSVSQALSSALNTNWNSTPIAPEITMKKMVHLLRFILWQ